MNNKPKHKRPKLTLDQAVTVLRLQIKQLAQSVPRGVERIRLGTEIHELGIAIATKESGMTINEDRPSKAIGILLVAIVKNAAETGRTHDEIVIELLSKIAPHGIPVDAWN